MKLFCAFFFKLTLFIFSTVLCSNLFAQTTQPSVEAVYGGRINDISGYALDATTSRVFIATESANSIFYSDVTASGSISFGAFNALSSMDANNNYGERIRRIEAHANSSSLFIAHPTEGLLRAEVGSSTVDVVFTGFVNDLAVVGDTLVFLNANKFYAYLIDSSGSTSPLINGISTGLSPSQNQRIQVRPDSSMVFLSSSSMGSHELATSNGSLSTLTNTSTFNVNTLSGYGSSIELKTFVYAPNGLLYFFGNDQSDKYILPVSITTVNDTLISYSAGTLSAIGGGVGGNIAQVQGSSSSFSLYYSKLYNHSNADPTAWNQFGSSSLETNPNDGNVYVDPINDDIVYMTTDQGIGASTNKGLDIFEINDGVEAVQVNDFDMNEDKSIGWMASKSGVRMVENLETAPVWTNALFPNGDGSPYYSIAMDPQDDAYVYAGNVRVYRTTDQGSSWNRLFSPEGSPYNFGPVGTYATAIEVSPFDSMLIVAAYAKQGTDKGGLFYSFDRGSTWDQVLLESSSIGQDVDVMDILFTIEGSDTVLYAGVEYDLSAPQGRSVYKLVKSGSSWSVTQDMNPSTTSTGSSITASIRDLTYESSFNTLFAVGTDAGINHPIAYMKELSGANVWTPLTTSGFPFSSGKQASASSIGHDTLFVAVDNEIYAIKEGESSWNLYSTYPNGTFINMLYYDALVAGTNVGFYSHTPSTPTNILEDEQLGPTQMSLSQNYPNPFNPSTTIHYSLNKNSQVKLAVYSVSGQLLTRLVDEFQTANSYKVNFDGSNLATGIYFYTLEIDDQRITRKMTLIK